MTFEIQVLKGKTWHTRATITQTKKGKPVTTPNQALRAHGINGRPRLGVVKSKSSGKQFRAVEVKG